MIFQASMTLPSAVDSANLTLTASESADENIATTAESVGGRLICPASRQN